MASAPSRAAPPSIGDLEGRRRVVLISAPTADDPALTRQRDELVHWAGAASRDVSVVELAGDTVAGAADSAASMRKKYTLPDVGFMVLLIGKDGHVAIRSSRPLSASMLAAAIDAMPMRRAGGR